MCLISTVTGRNLISGKELQHSNVYKVVLLNIITIIIKIITMIIVTTNSMMETSFL